MASYKGLVVQTRKHSIIESFVNVAIGYSVAVAAQVLVFPYFGVIVPFKDNLMIGAMFTVISIVRSYIIRRFFNGIKN